MIGLDDKGIAEAVDRVYPSGTGTYQVNPADRAIAKAQLKKVIDYLCTLDFYDDWGGESGKAVRDKIMQALLEELKE